MLSSAIGGRLMVERHGSSPARVIALHGWGRSHADWAPIVSGLDAVAPDLPGFGNSPEPPETWGTREYADFLLPLLEEAERPVLLGHSFGARVAVRLAASHPELVAGLVLTGAPLVRSSTRPTIATPYRIARRLDRMGLVPAATMDRLRNKYGSADYRATAGVMRSVFVRVVNEDYSEDLSRLSTPTRLVWGEQDREVPITVAYTVSQRVPSATVEAVAASGHLLDAPLGAALRRSVDAALELR
jgi:pimeloyl-ACP methyl ester carboxylesterase